ncbi:hydrogenase maturation protease [Dehalogenimonas formicexedens]|uniref:Hydrogenase maturation protease n=1 Tax=Dehalogenimonas formicexedens TaxID=1839801 RepID=A0A1P8F663_9CHLR|nr:hydrogenase maturation protease [Dehalogenimonas formicexedens]
METDIKKTTLILGAGNIAAGDEGFGVHVARRLAKTQLPTDVRIMEGGVGGFDLLGHLEGVTRLIIVDIIALEKPPGDLFLFKPGGTSIEPGKKVVSFHQVGVLELIQIAAIIGCEPEVFVLATPPETMDWSFELSPALSEAADAAVEFLRGVIGDEFASLGKYVTSFPTIYSIGSVPQGPGSS